jgi:hypothetical protein
MDRPNGVHNDEDKVLDRITQLKSILKCRGGDGHGPAISIATPIAIAVHNAINIHSSGILLLEDG